MMQDISVKTGSKEAGNVREAILPYEVPSNLQEAVATYGEDLVFDQFRTALVLAIQSPARRALTAAVEGSDYNEVVRNAMSTWKLGVKAQRKAKAPVDPLQALEAAWPTLSPERQREIAAKFGFSLAPVPAPAEPVLEEQEEAMAAGRRRR